MKRGAESLVMAYARKALKGVRIKGRVWLRYYWNEPDKRRDKDNIASYGMKVIQDALVRCGILQGDGWKQIEGFSHRFTACPKEPHITVIIEVVSKDT